MNFDSEDFIWMIIVGMIGLAALQSCGITHEMKLKCIEHPTSEICKKELKEK